MKIRESIVPRSGVRLIRAEEMISLLIGALILIVTFNVFLAPIDVAPGGVAGVSILINHFTGWPEGLTMLVLNIPVMVLGYRHLGRMQFLGRTVLVVLIYNLGVDLWASVVPPRAITDDQLLNALFGGVVGGIDTGLVYRGQGTAAGSGILSRIMQLRTGLPISQLYIMIDGLIILALALVFGFEQALYALLMMFIWGLATDYVLEGPSVVRTAFIVTDMPQDVSDALLTRVGVGVTAWPGQGMYSETQHTILFCTVSRPDVIALRAAITAADPKAFVVIGQGHRSYGGVIRAAASAHAGSEV